MTKKIIQIKIQNIYGETMHREVTQEQYLEIMKLKEKFGNNIIVEKIKEREL